MGIRGGYNVNQIVTGVADKYMIQDFLTSWIRTLPIQFHVVLVRERTVLRGHQQHLWDRDVGVDGEVPYPAAAFPVFTPVACNDIPVIDRTVVEVVQCDEGVANVRHVERRGNTHPEIEVVGDIGMIIICVGTVPGKGDVHICQYPSVNGKHQFHLRGIVHGPDDYGNGYAGGVRIFVPNLRGDIGITEIVPRRNDCYMIVFVQFRRKVLI